MTGIAAIGECMLELAARPDGTFRLGFGGDTLNTALYLARLGMSVDYFTALGDDRHSERMIAAWRAEGIGVAHVLRRPGRQPGLYMIEIDETGERRFAYWREASPARELFALPETSAIARALAGYGWIYLSGITLSLYDGPGRAALLEALDRARAAGGRVAFDGNYRPQGWPGPAAAREAVAAMLRRVDLALTGIEDERALFGMDEPQAIVERLRRSGVQEIVIKRGERGSWVALDGPAIAMPSVAVDRVLDTTAAGDSFNAAYIAARLAGAPPAEAAAAGHRLAAAVVQHPGAIIPKEAMPAEIVARAAAPRSLAAT